MKLILRYFKRCWALAVISPLLMLLEVFMDLMLPAIMAEIIDVAIINGDLGYTIELGLRMLVVTFIALLGGGGCAAVSSIAATKLGAGIREDLFKKVVSLSHKNIDELSTGNLITRLTNDVSQLEEVSRMFLRIRAPLQIIGSLVMAIIVSRRLSLIFVVFVPLLLITIYILVKKAFPLFVKMQERLDILNTRLKENLVGKRVVKVFVREEYEEKLFYGLNSNLSDTTVKANRTMAFMNPAMQIFLYGSITLTLWFGAKLVDYGELNIGSLIAFTNYLRQLLFSLMMFSNLIMRFSRAQASAARIEEVLNSEPHIKDRGEISKKIKGDIEFRDVTFSYSRGGDPVLKNISFSIKAGEKVAILGTTGSGKTSLASLIPRFYDIDSGEILIDGESVDNHSLTALRESISFVTQKTFLFSGSVMDNILYNYKRDERDRNLAGMHHCAAVANINTFLESLPDSYDSRINQGSVNLSGGQKQRISIARALSKKAPVIIFDDATSAVDVETEKSIYRALASEQGESTLIIITQRISSITDADRIIVLDDGEIFDSGNHKELLERSSLYQKIYYSQVDREA